MTKEDLLAAIEQSSIIHLDVDARYLIVVKPMPNATFKGLARVLREMGIKSALVSYHDPVNFVAVHKFDGEHDKRLAENVSHELEELKKASERLKIIEGLIQRYQVLHGEQALRDLIEAL